MSYIEKFAETFYYEFNRGHVVPTWAQTGQDTRDRFIQSAIAALHTHNTPARFEAVFWKAANDMFDDDVVDGFEQPYMDDESGTVDGRLPQELWEYMADRWVTTKETP